MSSVSTFYFSRVLNRNVYSGEGRKVGRLRDLIVDLSFPKPRVVAVRLNNGQALDATFLSVVKGHGQYELRLRQQKPIEITNSENILSIAKSVLDRQLVDIDGRKVVRVNDLRLAKVSTGIYLIAVDVGLEGLLRRLAMAKPLGRFLKLFHKTLPSRLILWDDVEAVGTGKQGIRLSTESKKLATLHPSDLADIIEDFDKYTQAAVFATLDRERAADVLEELEPEAQISIIDSLSVEKAADVLERMPSDEVADILDVIEDDKAEEILQKLNAETSEEVRGLMEYDDDAVGSIMSTDYVTFNKDMAVSEVLEELRRLKPELDTIFYLYIVNDEQKLVATVSLRDLVVSQPDTRLRDIMNQSLIFVYDHDSIDALTEIVSKYNLLAVPVVDDREIILGIVVINDVVYNLLRSRRKRL